MALTPWLRGVEGGRFFSSSPWKPPPQLLPCLPAQAAAPSPSTGRPAAGAVLPAGSAADRLLLGSDLPTGRLGGAAALELVKPPAGSQRRAPVAGSDPPRPEQAGSGSRRSASCFTTNSSGSSCPAAGAEE